IFLGLGGRTILGLGNADDGRCGGLATVTRHLFEAGMAPWEDVDPPEGDSPHFRELVWRQVDSFELGRVPFRFYDLAVARPDPPTAWSRLLRRRPRPVETVRREWPRIRADVDAGHLSMVGLVRRSDRGSGSSGSSHAIGADTGAPASGRTAYGATSVLIEEFCV